MADPPPPSYDDAITGVYSSAPEPSSSPPPPSFPPSSPSAALIPEPSAPPASNGDTTSVSSRQERPDTLLPLPSPESQERQRFRQSQVIVDDNEDNLLSRSKKIKILTISLFIFGILIGAAVLFWSVVSKNSEKEDLKLLKRFSCNDADGSLSEKVPEPIHCYRNSDGSYNISTLCEFNCKGNESLFGRNRTSDWFDLKSTSFTATCEGNSNWEVKVRYTNYKEIVCGKYPSQGCENYNPTIQCLPPQNPHNCNSPPPKISEAIPLNDCSKNKYGTFSDGQICRFKCERKYVLWNSEGVIENPPKQCLNARAPDSALKLTSLAKCKTEVQYAAKGDYMCTKGKWVSSEIGEINTDLECRDSPLRIDSCGYNPPIMPKATWWNCQERREYRNGEICHFKCDKGYILSNSPIFSDSDYETEGAYTCSNGKWDGRIKCLNLRPIVRERVG